MIYAIPINNVLDQLLFKINHKFCFIYPKENSLLIEYWDRFNTKSFYFELAKTREIFNDISEISTELPYIKISPYLYIELKNDDEILYFSLAFPIDTK